MKISKKEAHYQAMKGSMERAKLDKKLNKEEKKAFFGLSNEEVDRHEKETNEQKENTKKYKKFSLEEYRKKLHNWFYFTDNEVIDIQLAALIGEKLPGDPLWMFVIAPPGGLKTETLRGFTLSEDFFPLSDLTSKTFVSGLMLGHGDKRRKIEDLLPQLDKKVLIFKDFTTVLEKSQEERQQIFAQLREIYDGSFAKKFGTMDKTVRYDSRFGLIAGVTPIIDKHWRVMQQLGERFLKVRWNEDIDKVTRRARENEGKEKEMREDINKVAMGFITNIDFNVLPEFDDNIFGDLIDSFAKFVAIARTPISIQDYRSDFYFDYIPTPERPTRLVKQLKKLARCLALVRENNSVSLSELVTCKRVSLDTIPPDRRAILQFLAEYQKGDKQGCPQEILKDSIKMPPSSVMRVVEQLRMLDLIKIVTNNIQVSYGRNLETTRFEVSQNVIEMFSDIPPEKYGCNSKGQGVTHNVEFQTKKPKNDYEKVHSCVICGSNDNLTPIVDPDGLNFYYCDSCLEGRQ